MNTFTADDLAIAYFILSVIMCNDKYNITKNVILV